MRRAGSRNFGEQATIATCTSSVDFDDLSYQGGGHTTSSSIRPAMPSPSSIMEGSNSAGDEDETLEFFNDITTQNDGGTTGGEYTTSDMDGVGIDDDDEEEKDHNDHNGDGDDDDDDDDDDDVDSDDGDADPNSGEEMEKKKQKQQQIHEVEKLVHKETNQVRLWRRLLYIALFTTGFCATLATYLFLAEATEDPTPVDVYTSFNDSATVNDTISNSTTANDSTTGTDDAEKAHTVIFQSQAQSVEYFLRNQFNNTIQETLAFSEFLTLYASDENHPRYEEPISTNSVAWPFVTLPGFESVARHIVSNSYANRITVSPFVSSDALWGWSSYATINQDRVIVSSDEEETFIFNGIYQLDRHSTDTKIKLTSDILQSSSYPGAPIWQTYPIPAAEDINFNVLSLPETQDLFDKMMETMRYVVSDINVSSRWLPGIESTRTSGSNLTSVMIFPIFATSKTKTSGTSPKDSVVAMILLELDWLKLLRIPQFSDESIFSVVRNTCGQSYSFLLSDRQATYIGVGDLHVPSETNQVHTFHLDTPGAAIGSSKDKVQCFYSVSLYPTSISESKEDVNSSSDSHKVNTIISPLVVAISFIIVLLVFVVFDTHVQRKFQSIINKAAESNQILSSLFPSTVRDRLFNSTADSEVIPFKDQLASKNGGTKTRRDLSRYLNGENRSDDGNKSDDGLALDDDDDMNDDDDAIVFKTKPIADLFPEVTIMFTDIVGFTAWSSVREPHQVFTLLEAVYHAFDQIAKKRRVFKVETVGDSYVAVAGLPDPRADHATVMARFAHDCLKKIQIITKKLELVLGPDTGDLSMRCGLHSGPVTAGVLRGERSRFQLFGDTMNTASRMESTGVKDKIQISQETADELIAAGKVHWLTQREDKVIAKGKGEVETYWLNLDSQVATVVEDPVIPPLREDIENLEQPLVPFYSQKKLRIMLPDSSEPFVPSNLTSLQSFSASTAEKSIRLIDWNVELFLRQLKLIAARRSKNYQKQTTFNDCSNKLMFDQSSGNSTILDEVREVIRLPRFNAKTMKNQRDPDSIELRDGVEEELRDYVTRIAQLYRPNQFHNFEHASHVTMSASKLLSRIVEPAADVVTGAEMPGFEKQKDAGELHCCSYGITSDQLTQFACLFSALIHDVDHSGVPNSVMITENPQLARKYKGKSIAEQNSVNVAWNLLMQDEYKVLRQAIYANQEELLRFRQLVVNSVMATDIMDKDLKALRNNRWDKAFSDDTKLKSDELHENVNRKATIVIEHLIQASDVAHTMQHWHIYRKWNERLFAEMLIAYREGRTDHDPSRNWYENELGFFDHYIIPLAKKLKDCGVFGVSSDEYLNYAQHNRDEFAKRGKALIEEMVLKFS